MVASPCIKVCTMDKDSGLCCGCFRTLDEIARWTSIDDQERQEILARATIRRREHVPKEGQLRCHCGDGDS